MKLCHFNRTFRRLSHRRKLHEPIIETSFDYFRLHPWGFSLIQATNAPAKREYALTIIIIAAEIIYRRTQCWWNVNTLMTTLGFCSVYRIRETTSHCFNDATLLPTRFLPFREHVMKYGWQIVTARVVSHFRFIRSVYRSNVEVLSRHRVTNDRNEAGYFLVVLGGGIFGFGYIRLPGVSVVVACDVFRIVYGCSFIALLYSW